MNIYRIADFCVRVENIPAPVAARMAAYRIGPDAAAAIDLFIDGDTLSVAELEKNAAAEGVTDKNELIFLEVYRRICAYALAHDAFLMHCAVIEYEGRGYAFSAPSGTGKSTHVKLLKQLLGDDLTYINDDKPFVRVIDGKIYVYGSPWSGKHRRGNNIRAELKAITILLRGETNKVEKIDPADALDVLFRQTYRPEGETAALNAADILTDMLDNCDFYKLWCNISEEAAKTSFRYILKEESDEN